MFSTSILLGRLRELYLLLPSVGCLIVRLVHISTYMPSSTATAGFALGHAAVETGNLVRVLEISLVSFSSGSLYGTTAMVLATQRGRCSIC